jgi:hypothetical protein
MSPTAAKLQAYALRANFNPYYLAYALATGAASPLAANRRDGGNGAYFGWNSRMWVETRKRCALEHRDAQGPDHLETLAALPEVQTFFATVDGDAFTRAAAALDAGADPRAALNQLHRELNK